MTLTLRVLAPDQSVFDDTADEIILPSTTGLLGVLPGHISMVTAIDFGVLRVLKNGNWDSIALTGGFAEVESNEVTVLVNKAEMGKNIDSGKNFCSRFFYAVPQKVTSGNLTLACSKVFPLPSSCQ